MLALPINAETLKPHQLHYQSQLKGFTIQGVRELQREGEHYRLSQKARHFMSSIEEQALFRLDQQQIKPVSYSYSRNVFGKRLNRNNHFAADGSSVSFQENSDATITVALDGPAYDTLSLQTAIQLQLLTSAELEQQSYTMVNRQRLRDQDYRIVEHQWLATNAGFFDTVVIERQREGNDKSTRIWLAKDWDYIIVKIQHQQEDEPGHSLQFMHGTLAGKKIIGHDAMPTP